MRLASSRGTWAVFAVPVFLLLLIGATADRTTASFAQSEFWVSHTHEVETLIETLRANVFIAQDARKGYLLSNDPDNLQRYAAADQQLMKLTAQLKQLTGDNAAQQARIDRLDAVIKNKLAVLQGSIDLKKAGAGDESQQAEYTRQSDNLTVQMTTLLGSMIQDENNLLEQRVVISADSYRRMRIVLAVSFVAVLLFLFVSFGRLLIELRNRMRAEAAVRRLSGRILQLQDMERRKIARELHDGVGQYFSSSKMVVDGVLSGESLSEAQRKALMEAVQLLEQGIAEARTLSYLLHPPLLDEVGFRAAAEWYINGFSQRSAINVELSAPPQLEAMTKDIELVLFRVLQEALTNIHRHSGSRTAEVRIHCVSGRLSMEVEDRGKGISRALLEDFERRTGTGVGLAGMRERVSEFQGTLHIHSGGRGTLLRVEMPMEKPGSADVTSAGPPNLEAQIDLNTVDARNQGEALMLADLPLPEMAG